MKDDSFDCTLIAHLRIFLLFYRLLYCLILPENRLFFGIWKVVEIERTEGGQVIPTIHSRACLIGKGCLLLEEDDPLQDGFSVKCGEEVKI